MRWLVLGLVWLTMATTAAAVDDPPLREPDAAGVSAPARLNEGRGRLDDARAVPARLRPLDPREARELDGAIARAARR